MIGGILLLVLTGLCWVAIAGVISVAARKRLDINYIQALSALLCAAIAGLCPTTWSRQGAPPGMGLTLIIFAAGVGNYLMIKLMNVGMARGHNGIVWGMTQSALIFPFLMGILCFGVQPTVARVIGLLCILLAIALFSHAKAAGTGSGWGWLLPTLGAFLCAGASQCCANLPSYWHHAGVSSVYRTFWTQLGILATFGVDALVMRQRWNSHGALSPTLILAAVNVVALFFLFYHGLNIVAQHGNGAVGYPLAMGTSIAGFFLYSRVVLRERITPVMVTAFASVILGIVLLASV